MTTDKAFEVIGNCDIAKGKALIVALAIVLQHARTYHPCFAIDERVARYVVAEEAHELFTAADESSAKDEAFDVLATAVRFVNEEWGPCGTA